MDGNLSVCILLRDTGSNLLSCIDSIKEVADEIIIINASGNVLEQSFVGNSLQPGTFILEAGFLLVSDCSLPTTKIIDYKWNNDFSDARNAGLKEAICQWILSLDANDTVGNPIDILPYLNSPNDFFFLKFFENNLAEKDTIEGFDQDLNLHTNRETFDMLMYITPKPMLIKNGKGLKYQGRIYESLSNADFSNFISPKIADITVYHYFSSTNEIVSNNTFVKELLLRAFAEKNSLKLYYQAHIFTLKMQEEAEQDIVNEIIAFDTLLDSADKREVFEFWYDDAVNFLFKTNSSTALLILNKGLSVFPTSLNLLFHLYNSFLRLGKIFEAIKVLNFMILHGQPAINSKTQAKLIDKDYLYFLLSSACFESGNYPAFDFYLNKIIHIYKYQSFFNNLKDKLATHMNILSLLEDSLSETSFSYLRIAKEYLRELMFEKAKDSYFHSLKLAFKEDDLLIQKYIFSDLILNAKALFLDDDFISELFSEVEVFSSQFSYYWYCLGRFHLLSAEKEQALEAFSIAQKIEKNAFSKPSSDYQNIDDILSFSYDMFIDDSAVNFENFIKSTGSNFVTFVAFNSFFFTDSDSKSSKSDQLTYQLFFNTLPEQLHSHYLYNFVMDSYYWNIIKNTANKFNNFKAENKWIDFLKQLELLQPKVIVMAYVSNYIIYLIAKILSDNILIINLYSDNINILDSDSLEFLPKQNFIQVNVTDNVQTAKNLKEILKEKEIEFLFLGENLYSNLKNEFDICKNFVSSKGIIMLDNINKNVDSSGSEINKLWRELWPEYKTKEIYNNQESLYSGIGIIFKSQPVRKVFEKFNFVRFNHKDVKTVMHVYDDVITLLKYSFDELGIENELSFNELKHGFNNIIFTPFSVPKLNNYMFDYTYIPFQTEQLVHLVHIKHDTSYIRMLYNSKRIWDYSKDNISFLKSINIENVSLLRFGYHPKMEILNFNKNKDFDIIFYGNISERRKKVLLKLEDMGYKIKILWNLYGSERNSFIERAKIILNINYFDNALLEEYRLSFLANNGCFVISESANYVNDQCFKDGIVFCDYEKLVETCEFYLRPENEFLRDSIAKKGYDTFSKYKMTDNLKKALKETLEGI